MALIEMFFVILKKELLLKVQRELVRVKNKRFRMIKEIIQSIRMYLVSWLLREFI